MYNLRYHIASLVAVFLALTVGLLLGSIVVERGLLSSQQTTLVQGLQTEFETLRTESAGLKAENDALASFADDAAPGLLGGALAGRTVLVIASPDAADTAARATEAVRVAGGRAAVATFAGERLSLSDDAVAEAVAGQMGVDVASLAETRVIEALAHEWGTPDAPRPLTRALTSSGGLKLQGLPASATVDAVAVAAVYDGSPDTWAMRLAKSLLAEPAHGVGVDTTKRNDGSARAAKGVGLSGVDDVDTAVGRVSFVWILSGRAQGLFGRGEGVTARYPSPLFGK